MVDITKSKVIIILLSTNCITVIALIIVLAINITNKHITVESIEQINIKDDIIEELDYKKINLNTQLVKDNKLSSNNGYTKLKDGQIIATKIAASEFIIDMTDIAKIREYSDTYFLYYKKDVYISSRFLEKYYENTIVDDKNIICINGLPKTAYLIKQKDRIFLNEKDKNFNALKKGAVKKINKYDEVEYIGDGYSISYTNIGVSFIEITKPLLLTDKGITVGATRKEVINKYGQLGNQTDSIWYSCNYNPAFNQLCGLEFKFNDNKIIKIRVSFR